MDLWNELVRQRGNKLRVKILRPNARVPERMSGGASGLDLHACIDGDIKVLAPGKRCVVPIGIAVAIPPGFEGQVRPRSGLAKNQGITVLNTPGTVDFDYRGELGVILINHGETPFEIKHGERVAQFVIVPVLHVDVEVVEELDETARGAGGFGSTGVK